MVKQLIEVGRGCIYFYDGEGDTETVYPKGKTADYLADRAKRRAERHEDRRWRYERHGLIPGIEVHTV
ncbi:hypothetical protein [Modicisalibacter luteus]|uniref:Uncharacterized protein n=1 Tax=Modicisalibacter luteus TaxID=453962 RepID=A0ABV7M2V1_9GAMM|nr:hypothetical protein [Halomonas lutea]GHA85190.1 hypothetical protein GCM10007159_02830 [Halomonas lutea]